MSHRRFTLSLIALVGLLPGAGTMARADYGVTTSQPLSDPLKGGINEGLIGTWRAVIRGNAYYFHVGAGNLLGKLNWMELVLVKPGKKRPEFYMRHFIGFPTVVGDETYFNIGYTPKLIPQLRGAKPEQITASVDRYDIFLYKLTGDTLDIFSPDQRLIRAAIQAGKIKGSGAKIEETREDLIKFIKSSGKKLFPRKFRYTRVKDAESPGKKVQGRKSEVESPTSRTACGFAPSLRCAIVSSDHDPVPTVTGPCTINDNRSGSVARNRKRFPVARSGESVFRVLNSGIAGLQEDACEVGPRNHSEST